MAAEPLSEIGTVLLDTTYLLPLLGGEVDLPDYEELYPKFFKTLNTVYNPLSLVEAKWIVLRLARKQDKMKREEEEGKSSSSSFRREMLQSYLKGLAVLSSSDDAPVQLGALTSHDIESVADELLTSFEITDYFDRMIYATASVHSFTLLTEDDKLRQLEHRRKSLPKPKGILSWKQLREKLGRS